MEPRDLHSRPASIGDFVLRGPPNWTIVLLLLGIGAMHLSIAIPAFLHGHWQGFLSLILGCVFLTASTIAWRIRPEVGVLTSKRALRLRAGVGRLYLERFIPFSHVRGVRVTLSHPTKHVDEALIQVVCDDEDIECPPTDIPQQEALYLAVAMGVRLIKVSDEDDGGDGQKRETPEMVNQP